MGRKRNVYGTLYKGPRGRPVRLVISKGEENRVRSLLGLPTPRGKTGKASVFSAVLKELSPLVYAFLVYEFKKPQRARNEMIRPIIEEWKHASGLYRNPSSREFGAFVIERAMEGAWQVWGIKRPHTEGDAENFRRWYVLGHDGALRRYRKVLQRPTRPEERTVKEWLPYFFGPPGEAARQFNLVKTEQEPWTIIALAEEKAPRYSP